MCDEKSLVFPKKMRLLKQEEFDTVFEGKISCANRWIIVYGRKNGLDFSRLGLKVSKKNAGKRAVDRNRWKRIFREVFRLLQHEIPFGVDFVLLPKRGQTPEFHAVYDSFEYLSQNIVKRLESK